MGDEAEVQGQTASINELPTEVMMMVLDYLSGKTLFDCRLVSARWREVASSVCRRHQVRVIKRKSWRQLELDQVFSNPAHIPWSSVAFCLDPELFGRSEILNLLNQIGSYLQEITVLGNCMSDIYGLLQSTPLLKRFKICLPPELRRIDLSVHNCSYHHQFAFTNWYIGDPTEKGTRLQMVANSLKLPHLTNLSFPITGIPSLALFEEILTNSGVHLKKIHVNFMSTDLQMAIKVASLLTRIPYISLELHFNPKEKEISNILLAFSSPGIKVTKLALNIHHEFFRTGLDFTPLEQFLKRHEKSLEKLWLRAFRPKGIPERIRFQIPQLVNLKCLKFVVDEEVDKTWKRTSSLKHPLIPYGFIFLENFRKGSFPFLRKVVLDNPQDVSIFNSVSVSSVQEFVLKTLQGEVPNLTDGHWNRVFPNMKTLETAVDFKNLFYILSNMQNLVNLVLTVGIPGAMDEEDLVDEFNINFLLSGIPGPAQALGLSKWKIQKLFKNCQLPSLRSLKRLKTLKLSFFGPRCMSCDTKNLDDAGVLLAILPLRRLNALTLENTRISEEFEERLRTRHNHCLIRYREVDAVFNTCEHSNPAMQRFQMLQTEARIKSGYYEQKRNP